MSNITVTERKLNFERLHTMAPLKQEIILHLFDYMVEKKWGVWWKFNGEFRYDGRDYTLECECMMDNKMLSYRHMFIEYKQVVIDLDEMEKAGLLN
jgi:hypothetical protein